LTEKRQSIAYIVNSLNLGGTENLVVQMSRAFLAEYDIRVICLDEPGLWAPTLRDAGMPVYCFWRQPGIDLSIAGKIARCCKTHTIELIHAHQCTPGFYAALSRLTYSSPKLLFEEHGRHYPETYNWKKNTINKWFIQNLTHTIIAVSADVRQRLDQYEGITASRIDVIYNGVHPPQKVEAAQKATLRQQLGFSPNDFVVGTVGRLDPIKNLPMLLRAFAAVKAQYTQLKMLLVGDGPERTMLETLCNELAIADQVIMTGYRQDATDLLQCMDLFVLCSFSEGTSMALLEAMASETPVIVSDVGGNPELIQHNKNGWIIPSQSVTALSQAIDEALCLQGERVRRGRQAKRDFEQCFSFPKMINNYRTLYQKMLA